jgi:GNAT superfamily N-acetyltransferase
MDRLTRENKLEVVNTLMAAFYDYPVMRFVLKTKGAEYDEQVTALIAFFCEARLAKEGLVMGIRNENRLIAVGLVDEAVQKPWHEWEAEHLRLKEAIGDEAYSRLELYETLSSRAEPQEPHYFVGMLGVLPEHQGEGHARKILDAVKDLSIQDQRSAGVCLSTERLENVSLYEHFGYRVIAEVKIDQMQSWCMFLPTSCSL